MENKPKTTLKESILQSLHCACIIPSILFVLYLLSIIALLTLKLSLIIFFVIFIVIPLVFKHCYTLQRSVIFLNFVNVRYCSDYSNPSKCNIDGVLNFFLTTNEDVTLGTWHILPQDIMNNSRSKEDEDYYLNSLRTSENVIIYCHGNAGNRAVSHRIELYKVLRKHFHVIAFDYRSYGDSSNIEPTEEGVVNDTIFVYKWVKNQTNANVYIWGHSLGTGISTHALAKLAEENINPTGLFLESPFNNMRDEISEHPLSKIFRNLPWFSYTMIEPMQENNFTFESDRFIKKINCPIIILHAKDDNVVPFHLGLKLFKAATESRLNTQGTVDFYGFDEEHKYGHKFICRSPKLSNIIKTFMVNCVAENEKLAQTN